MNSIRLAPMEADFAEIIWSHEPLGSGELVKRSEQELGWKKSTTYTVLKKLCDRGLFRNENGLVTSRVSRESIQKEASRDFVESRFSGSLPAFLAAFTAGRRLTPEEAESIRQMIEACEEGDEA